MTGLPAHHSGFGDLTRPLPDGTAVTYYGDRLGDHGPYTVTGHTGTGTGLRYQLRDRHGHELRARAGELWPPGHPGPRCDCGAPMAYGHTRGGRICGFGPGSWPGPPW